MITESVTLFVSLPRIRHIVGSILFLVKTKISPPLNAQLAVISVKTGWHRINIMCRSGATCLPENCSFSELAHYANPTKSVGLV